jgi:enoyl-CoA hydratase/carnithine racemase
MSETLAAEKIAEQPGRLVVKREGRVGTVVFDSQRKFNAVNMDMWMALPKAIGDFVDDPEIRVIVLEGAGEKAFISGADISQFGEKRNSAEAQAEYNRATAQGYMAVLNCPKPTIAKIKGVCMGGGLGLAGNCDLRFCSDDAKFRMPAARLGLGYAFDGIKRFAELIGPDNVSDLFFSARIFGAADALQMGFVSKVLPKAELDAFMQGYCTMVSENAPLTIAATKRALLELRKASAERDLATVAKMIEACFDSADYKEGRTAFMEKRTPDFRGA